MDLLKRGIPLSDLYGGSFSSSYHADSRDSVLCSCLSPDSKSNCCLRRIERFHKMGWALIKELFDRKKMKKKGFGGGENIEILRAGEDRRDYLTTLQSFYFEGNRDFRNVMVIRNIYQSLISGYLYHK